jgi:hypothetical protein
MDAAVMRDARAVTDIAKAAMGIPLMGMLRPARMSREADIRIKNIPATATAAILTGTAGADITKTIIPTGEMRDKADTAAILIRPTGKEDPKAVMAIPAIPPMATAGIHPTAMRDIPLMGIIKATATVMTDVRSIVPLTAMTVIAAVSINHLAAGADTGLIIR